MDSDAQAIENALNTMGQQSPSIGSGSSDAQAIESALNNTGNIDAVQKASQYVGQPIDEGYCETFAEHITGEPNMGGSAAEAAQNYANQGKLNTDVSQVPAGALIYFAPDQSNGYDGHVGISDGQGGMISATYGGVQQNSLSDWVQQTGQQPIGYVMTGGQ